MENLVTPTLLGAAIGLTFGFLRNTFREKKNETYNLGKEWPYLKTDEHIRLLMHNIMDYGNLNDKCKEYYFIVGDDINKLMELSQMVSDANGILKKTAYPPKAHIIKENANKYLFEWAKEIKVYKGFHQKDKEPSGVTAKDFGDAADAIMECIDNLFYNIKLIAQGN